MQRTRPLLFLIFAAFALSGCQFRLGPDSTAPTPFPDGYLPTVVALTAAALPTPTQPDTFTPAPTSVLDTETPASVPTLTLEPSTTPTITGTIPSPTRTLSPVPTLTFTPTITLTPTLTPDDYLAAVQILSLGPMSKVVSPINLRAYVVPGDRNQVRVELIGEDGRLITRVLTKVYNSFRPWGFMDIQVSYEIRAAGEVARLQIVTEDRYGRTSAIESERLLLMSVGADELLPAVPTRERFFVDVPRANGVVSGGTVIVKGQIQPFNTQPVVFELIGQDGGVIGSKLMNFPNLEQQDYTAVIPYSVSAPTSVRLVMRQADDRINGIIHLVSREITLLP
jgi:hypothetical protein